MTAAIKHREYWKLKNQHELGMVGRDKHCAVTFVDNHDTIKNGFTQYGEMMAAYAYILTHPGFPCIFWKALFLD